MKIFEKEFIEKDFPDLGHITEKVRAETMVKNPVRIFWGGKSMRKTEEEFFQRSYLKRKSFFKVPLCYWTITL
ncbi:hypothetical protein KKH16_00970 [Patescibacteria group bacterium]|nr:hypothetical protein [Patescibacteria group bacterium]